LICRHIDLLVHWTSVKIKYRNLGIFSHISDSPTKSAKPPVQHCAINYSGHYFKLSVVKFDYLLITRQWRFEQMKSSIAFDPKGQTNLFPFSESEAPIFVILLQVKILGSLKN